MKWLMVPYYLDNDSALLGIKVITSMFQRPFWSVPNELKHQVCLKSSDNYMGNRSAEKRSICTSITIMAQSQRAISS